MASLTKIVNILFKAAPLVSLKTSQAAWLTNSSTFYFLLGPQLVNNPSTSSGHAKTLAASQSFD